LVFNFSGKFNVDLPNDKDDAKCENRQLVLIRPSFTGVKYLTCSKNA
jgi:hypothetical protein